MEDTKTQPGNQPALETLKIRAMRDDLKKASGQPVLSAPPIIPIAPRPQEYKPAPQPTAPTKIGEPPVHLPGVVISPEPPKPAIFTPPIRQTVSSPPPTPKPVFAPKPVLIEPTKTLSPLPAAPASSGLFIKLAIAGVIVLLVAVGAYFFWPKEQPPLPPLEPPVSLIPADSTSVISIKNETELTNKLSEVIATSQPQETLKYIPVKVTEPKEEFLSLEKFLNTLTISLPEVIAGQTDGKYSLFSYSQSQSTSSSETENRFILVLSLSSPADVQVLKDWEPKILQNLELLYSTLPDDMPSQINFADSERKDIFPHRFVNFGSPDLSLDYAITGNKLIFATSKQSMDKILDLTAGSNE